jgi:hypothetical protein
MREIGLVAWVFAAATAGYFAYVANSSYGMPIPLNLVPLILVVIGYVAGVLRQKEG